MTKQESYMGELYHHGILGQRWGVRRFQNPDGSLTEAGKKRYLKYDFSPDRKGYYISKRGQRKLGKEGMDLYNKKRETDKKAEEEAVKKSTERINEIDKITNPEKKREELQGLLDAAYDDIHSERSGKDGAHTDEKYWFGVGATNYILDRATFNWSDQTPKTEGTKKQLALIAKLESELRTERNKKASTNTTKEYRKAIETYKNDPKIKGLMNDISKAHDDMLGIILTDMGISDTPTNRKKIETFVGCD